MLTPDLPIILSPILCASGRCSFFSISLNSFARLWWVLACRGPILTPVPISLSCLPLYPPPSARPSFPRGVLLLLACSVVLICSAHVYVCKDLFPIIHNQDTRI